MLASALVPEKLSVIRRCPLFGVWRFLKYSIYGKRSWYIAHCPLYGRCPLFGVSAKRVPLYNSVLPIQVFHEMKGDRDGKSAKRNATRNCL